MVTKKTYLIVLMGILVCLMSSCRNQPAVVSDGKGFLIEDMDSVEYTFRNGTSVVETFAYVSSPRVAIEIAKAVIEDICDDNKYKLHSRYEVILVDNKYWSVSGYICTRNQSNEWETTGGFLVEIDRLNGEILRVNHSYYFEYGRSDKIDSSCY